VGWLASRCDVLVVWRKEENDQWRRKKKQRRCRTSRLRLLLFQMSRLSFRVYDMQCLLAGMKVKVGEGQEWDGRKGTREIKETECDRD